MPLAREAQNNKVTTFFDGGVVPNSTSTGSTISVAGAGFARIAVHVEPGSNSGTTNGIGSFDLQGSTETSGTNFSSIAGYTGTTNTTAASGEFLLSEFNTAGGEDGNYVVDVDLRGRELERLQLVAADATGSAVTTSVALHGNDVTPDNQVVVRPANLR